MSNKKSELKEYAKIINEKYGVNINDDNYADILLRELSYSAYLSEYFKEYINENKEKLSLEWAHLMFLFIHSVKEKNATSVVEYSKKLRGYVDNYYVEYILGDIDLMFYGDVFKSKDRFIKALTLRENDANAYYSLGFIYNLLGVFDKSLEYYNKAIYYYDNSTNPKDIKLKSLYNVAAYYITVNKDLDRGEEILNSLLEEEPNHEKAIETLKRLKGEM
ncbi:hypothetical protein KQI86_11275 [Clostridium sp. MSJ-11]|uniref:Tetratricopeptide repeat protein n=1 Tax=Clostridium mobile TaxID=2841512 RepID=A0ABS6EIF2_9CLOT|nr:hypothetical protein [Clostridium mobile]MBU5484917.1 hypothetical protein [Clostridium mobile]